MLYQFYKEFSDPSEEFQDEPRAFCYELACKLINEAKQESSNWYVHAKTIQGILLLLFCWNFTARKTKKLTISKVRNLLENNKNELAQIEGYSLLTFDGPCEEKIKKVYNQFRDLFGQTGRKQSSEFIEPEAICNVGYQN